MKRRKLWGIRNWTCYYGAGCGVEEYGRFDLAVLDGHYHPPLARRSGGRPLLLGYVSTGEVEEGGHLWPWVKEESFLLKKNGRWNTWIMDVRDLRWRELLLGRIIPSVLRRGFDGLFLDTVDSCLGLTLGDEEEQYSGIPLALEGLIREIRDRFPRAVLAMNRGLPLLPAVAGVLDCVVIEGLYSEYAGPEKGYRKVPRETRTLLLEQLARGLEADPDLTVLTLDYDGNEERELAREAVSFSRVRGFIPYVGNYRLDQIFLDALEG
ncbi:MAG: endo alpha-1,4 polygalactosaminidase [Deltaproteobacteria bacterium]|nr:endo alpha-1,4 polygalactosaminidase [Deltaproteobacteria bacterium]MBW2304938.1 endo alpha-1,4 polygalactosaminidase [Deltaproteobacteria bacterium]